MEKEDKKRNISLWLSGFALFLSVITISWNVYQFAAQNRSDLLANCAFDGDAKTRLESTGVNRGDASQYDIYKLAIETKCLVLNNGRKPVSIIKARSVETYDGRPVSRQSIRPVSLFENDLVDGSLLPFTLAPGESKEINVWLRVDLDTLNAGAVSKCIERPTDLDTYSDYDGCFANQKFFIANYIYVEPYPANSFYNGVGIQFVTNESTTNTFEVSVLRASLLATRGEGAKNYDEDSFTPTYNEEGIYLERGYKEHLELD